MTGARGTTRQRLTGARIRGGVWEAALAADDAPRVAVTHLDRPLPQVTVAPRGGVAGEWLLRAPIPADLLSDGVQTFVVTDEATGERLGHFTILAGVPLEDDLRAEIDLLRAELDMLKRAFRRHCVETAGG